MARFRYRLERILHYFRAEERLTEAAVMQARAHLADHDAALRAWCRHLTHEPADEALAIAAERRTVEAAKSLVAAGLALAESRRRLRALERHESSARERYAVEEERRAEAGFEGQNGRLQF